MAKTIICKRKANDRLIINRTLGLGRELVALCDVGRTADITFILLFHR